MVRSHVSREVQSLPNSISARKQGVGAGNTTSTNSAAGALNRHAEMSLLISKYFKSYCTI